MSQWSRREAFVGIAGVVAAASTAGILSQSSQAEVTGHHLAPLGQGADFPSLRPLLSVFFGNARGRYVRDNVVNDEDPRINFETLPVYDQFSAVYSKGTPEYDAVMTSGQRMIVCCVPHQSMYKALLFLEPDGETIAAAAMTFYYSPPAGVTETIAGEKVQFDCEQQLSLVVFYATEFLDPVILQKLKSYFRQYPMVREQSLAAVLGYDKVRMRFYGRNISQS
jgi:hypothetical protein